MLSENAKFTVLKNKMNSCFLLFFTVVIIIHLSCLQCHFGSYNKMSFIVVNNCFVYLILRTACVISFLPWVILPLPVLFLFFLHTLLFY